MGEQTPMIIKSGSLEKCIRHVIQSGGKYRGHQLSIVQHAGISGSMVVTQAQAECDLRSDVFAGYRIIMTMTGAELRRMVGYAQLNLFPGGDNGDDPTAI